MGAKLSSPDTVLLNLGIQLKERGYRFTTITPETHSRINGRLENSVGMTIEHILGWSRPFRREGPLAELADTLKRADALDETGPLLRSRVRFSTVGKDIFLHSAFPTTSSESVFFGPDTYRFVRVLRESASRFAERETAVMLDIGAGSGAGAITLASLIRPRRAVLTDINPIALRYSEVNIALAGLTNCQTLYSDVLGSVDEPLDLIISNPPYLQDSAARKYRHGGATLGIDLSVRIAQEAMSRLNPGGHLLLYTGSPIIEGRDVFWSALEPYVDLSRFAVEYSEVDPDVFGEELDTAPYARCDRLAAVSLLLTAKR